MTSLIVSLRRIVNRPPSAARTGREATAPELNLIPEEMLGRRLSGQERRILLLGLSLLLIGVLQVQIVGAKSVDTVRAVVPGLRGADLAAEEAASLQRQIDRIRSEIRQNQLALSEIETLRIDWGGLFADVYGTGLEGIQVDTVRQVGAETVLTGSAADSSNMLAFREALASSAFISRVDLSTSSRDQAGGRVSFVFRLSLVRGAANAGA